MYLLGKRTRRLFYYRIFRNQRSIILFEAAFCLAIALIALLGFGFPIQRAMIYAISLTFAVHIRLILIGANQKAKRLAQKEVNSCFHFNRSNMNGVPISELGFSEPDHDNLNLLLKQLQPKNKNQKNLLRPILKDIINPAH